ncbi:MAG: HAMP domain-containing sensor histidine kinase [Acidobacteriota bacterium]
MRRGGLIAAGVAAFIVLGALGWLVREVVHLEAQERRARSLAQHEERVRLALWRLDSALATFLAGENARAVDRTELSAAGDPAFVQSRFERRTDPLDHGQSVRTPAPDVAGEPSSIDLPPIDQILDLLRSEQGQPNLGPRTDSVPPGIELGAPVVELEAQNQALRNTVEFSMRQQIADQQTALLPRLPRAGRVVEPLRPLWIDGRLLLVRRIVRGGDEAVQGLVLDAQATRGWLLDQVRDLLPGADLVPAAQDDADPGRRLALLPWRLVPGEPPPVATASSVRGSLVLAIGATALALLALVLLVAGGLHLARRRGDFAAAVVHELRTPLTTFRLYTELLAEDQVPARERPRLLNTLRREADRLGHLVENVLAYARLEHTRAPRPEALELRSWLVDMLPELENLADDAGFQLDARIDTASESNEEIHVVAEGVGLERILHNLLSNSLRYAAGTERLELTVRAGDRLVTIDWRDYGPGIERATWRRLVRPFHRARRESAAGADGLGLGLALSRQLARRWGGELKRLDPDGEPGLRLRLQLQRTI